MKKIFCIIKLIFFYSRDLFHSNIKLAIEALRAKPAVSPNMIKLPVTFSHDYELLLLAHLITITPGTLSVDYMEDEAVLLIHIMFSDETDDFYNSMTKTYIPLIKGIFG